MSAKIAFLDTSFSIEFPCFDRNFLEPSNENNVKCDSWSYKAFQHKVCFKTEAAPMLGS